MHAEELAAHAEAVGARVEHVDDLLLAWMAARGDAAALRRLEQLVGPDIGMAAQRIDRSPAFVDEVRQAVRVRLLVGERPRIGEYAGRGPLRGWVGVTATRVALNLKRAAGPARPGDDVLGDLVSAEPDPELRQLKTLYRAEFRSALEAAIGELPDRQRTLLRLCYVDGLRLLQIGRLYKVHESTASRWIAAAVEAVAEGTRRLLVARLSISKDSVDSVARMVVSNLDLSIARILGG